MSYDIDVIEDKIVEALKGSDLGGIARTIDSYHGEIEDLIAEVQQMIAPVPAVYVLYSGSEFAEHANRSYDERPVFSIVVVAKSLRSRGDLKDSIYSMLKIVKTALIDKDFDLDIDPLNPLKVEAVLVLKVFSVYKFDVRTWFSLD